MGVAAEDHRGRWPALADTPDQMLEHGSDLLPGWRLALPQEYDHRLAALDIIDMDGQEAAGVIVSVEQRQLLLPMHRVAGVVDIQRD